MVYVKMDIKNKFISIGSISSTKLIIEDYMFYNDNEKEIENWLELHDANREGLIIDFPSEQIKTWFLLRWQ